MDSEALKKLDIGSKVIVSSRYCKRIAKVEKLTKTMIILNNGYRLRRDTGSIIGADTWNTTSIIEATPENMKNFEIDYFKGKIKEFVSNHYLEHFNHEELKTLYLQLKNKVK